MEKQAIITRVFLGNGGGVHSRIWCRAESGEYNFDVIGLEEARKYQRVQTITIRIVAELEGSDADNVVAFILQGRCFTSS